VRRLGCYGETVAASPARGRAHIGRYVGLSREPERLISKYVSKLRRAARG
jgi:hypothetical protein